MSAASTLSAPAVAITPPRLQARDFINLHQLNRREFFALLEFAEAIKADRARFATLLAGRGLAMLFEKPSLRTRVTFDVAMQEMGGHAVFLDFADSPLGEREDIEDVARNLELWTDAIVARTFEHESIVLLAAAARAPVINGLSDHSHPCQALADFLTLRESFAYFPQTADAPPSSFKLAYVGDGNNTLHSLLEAAALSGIRIGVATPPRYEPDRAVVARAESIARRTGARIEIGTRIESAVRGADAIYTDTWASMGQEAEATRRARVFARYQVNAALMGRARAGARFLHCLPAHRGQEVTADVIDSGISLVYQQAENRLHAQKAVLASLLMSAPARRGPTVAPVPAPATKRGKK